MNTLHQSPAKSTNAVILHPRSAVEKPSDPWQKLTAQLVMEKHRRGELDARLLEYLLVGVGLQP